MMYRHLKSGRLYEVISQETINATNDRDGQILVIYIGDKKDGSGKGVFAREYKEFHEKFIIARDVNS